MSKYSILLLLLSALGIQSCSTSHSTGSTTGAAAAGTAVSGASPSGSKHLSAVDQLLTLPGLQSAQVGVVLYDPATSENKINYQGNKYFIPASNVKLFSLYAGMKYLGDSIAGAGYQMTDTALFILPTGDPTFLHPSFADQPVIRFMQRAHRKIWLAGSSWQDKPLGRGWAWDDYNDDYAQERSPFPIYGNYIRWVFDSVSASFYSIPDISWPVRFSNDSSKQQFFVRRDYHANVFEITEGKTGKEQDVPFITDGVNSAAALLKDTAGSPVGVKSRIRSGDYHVIYSRPVDSLFRPMMYNSDNFFAEQTLLMVSNHVLGRMNDARIIDTLLKTDFSELPQRPVWVDGCGLSRNDLFTPQDFVWVLDKMQKDFGLERLKNILPTGGKGTLSAYYKQDSSFIFAKTGSLSGVVALSGYLYDRKNRLLLFSVLINNYMGSGTAVRRQIEQMVHRFREEY